MKEDKRNNIALRQPRFLLEGHVGVHAGQEGQRAGQPVLMATSAVGRCMWALNEHISSKVKPTEISKERRGIPSSGLIDAFGNEVCRKSVLKFSLALKWVMNLGIGHTSTLEPTVEHLRHAPQQSFPTAGGDGQVVDADKQKICHLYSL